MGVANRQSVSLGQYTHHAATAITSGEVETEFTVRGYSVHVPVEPHVPTAVVTRSFAIKVAVDVAIESFNLPRTSQHFYRCPQTGGCGVSQSRWPSMINWTAQVASIYYSGARDLPTWAQSMLHSGVRGLGVVPLGGWIQENPWFVTALAAALAIYGQYLTAQQVKEAIAQSGAPAGAIKKEDIPGIMAQLAAQGAIPAGKEATVEAGLDKATTPAWLWPVAIGGGILVAVILFKK